MNTGAEKNNIYILFVYMIENASDPNLSLNDFL